MSHKEGSQNNFFHGGKSGCIFPPLQLDFCRHEIFPLFLLRLRGTRP